MMNEVYSRVFLGGIEDACKAENLSKAGITHILTLDSRPLSKSIHQGFTFTYKFVHILDLASSDLLTYFEDCLKFIEDGRQAGCVLVHCHVGQSRSATIVLAYLMQKLNITLEDAIAQVMKIRPQIRPNVGFLSQLQLFENMGSKIDPVNPEYKMYRLNLLALRMQTDQMENCLAESSLISDPTNCDEVTGVLYKCRKCRRPLFRKSALLNHKRGCGEAAFDWRSSRLGSDKQNEEECTQSLFLEPIQWMRESISCLSGKLTCPKCQAKLGSFNWAGEPCPCGTWMTPAFHIHKSKVDECKSSAVLVQAKQDSGVTLQQKSVATGDAPTLPSTG